VQNQHARKDSGFGRGRSDARLAVVVLHDPRLNGATIATLRAIPALEDAGWRFAFWVPAPGPAFDWLSERGADVAGAVRPEAAGLRSLRAAPGVRRNLTGMAAYLRHMRRFLREQGPEVVHANSFFSFAEAISARMAGHPTLLHIHDMPPGGRGAAVARWIAEHRVDDAIAVSGACAGAYRHGEWMPEVVYESAPLPAEPVKIRPRRKPFVVGTVGVVAARKGSDVFVAAARMLPDDGSIALRMVGAASDPLEREWGEGVIQAAHRPASSTSRRRTSRSRCARGTPWRCPRGWTRARW
jgi:glycosyltransferase involved in cell wall biosynthesis